jgi:hypothetical protein
MSRERALIASNGVITIDPETKEVRPAGAYDEQEWRTLRYANPDLATALIENRQRRKDEERALESKRGSMAFAGGTLAAAAIAGSVDQARVNQQLVKVFDWHNRSLVPEGTIIYESDNARVFAPAPGVVEFSANEGLDFKDARNEAIRARGAFREFGNKPEGEKLFRVVATDADPIRASQKQEIFEKMGFSAPGYKNVQRLDQRKGAKQFGNFYTWGDRALQMAEQNPVTTSKALRYGGAAMAGLALGRLAHGVWDMMNPISQTE